MTEPPHRRGQDHDGLLHRPAITPALTAEEWAYFTSGGIQKHVQQYAVEAAERDRAHDLTPHSLAALCLYGQPFGFTREMVAAIRELLDEHIADDSGPFHESWKSDKLGRLMQLATDATDRLDALLPPA